MFKYFLSGTPLWFSRAILILIIVSSVAIMSYAAYHESATFDESAHIPAGYAYVRFLDYRLNPEHPPLLKAIAAVPLLFLNLNFPTQLPAWQTDVNGQWVMGGNFFYNSGNDGALIVRAARIGPILVTLLLALLIYFWASKLVGKFFALIPTLFFAWSPNVLAHGHYVTTDIAAAFGITLATMFFVKFIFFQSRKNLLFAGLTFGLAQLLKFSAVLLVPFFLGLIFVYCLATIRRDWNSVFATGSRIREFISRGFVYLRKTIAIFVIGYTLVVYPVYFLFTYHYPAKRQVSDTTAILSSFQGGQTPEGKRCALLRCPADITINAAKYQITRPLAEYSLGVLTTLQRAEGGNANYFMGKVSGTGTSTYFPTVYLLKEPLAILVALLTALLIGISFLRRAARDKRLSFIGLIATEKNFTIFTMLLFVAFYWFMSITSPLNIGLRHLFPVLPFTYILIVIAWRRWIVGPALPEGTPLFESAVTRLRELPFMFMRGALLLLLSLWLVFATIISAPYFLSYFNELGGGTANGYRYVTDSNYDWGQDLYYLKDFMDQHPEIGKIAVDYFGGGSPRYTLGDKEENWWSARGNPADAGIHYFAVSVNTLEGSIQPTRGFYERKAEDEYRWLINAKGKEPGLGGLPKPDYIAGTSIFIYKL
ncbi:MAG: glycosyltransferase family 39 protein [Candidatus Liptonbacteria bacterium]